MQTPAKPTARASVLARADNLLGVIETTFVGVAIAGAACLLFVNVTMRYIFVSPISWAEELSLYLIVWIVFVGSSIAMRTQTHIGVDLLPLVLPPAGRRILALLVGVLILAFLAVFFYYSGVHTLRIYGSGQVTPVMLAPMWLTYLAMPVGAALMFLRTVQILVHVLRSDMTEAPASEVTD